MGSAAGQLAIGAGLVAASFVPGLNVFVAGALFSAGLGIGLGAAAQAFAPGLKTPKSGPVNRTVRSGLAFEQVPYGRVRTGGVMVAIDRHMGRPRSGPDRDYLDLVIVVSARRIQAWRAIYVGDERVTLEVNNGADSDLPSDTLIPVAGSIYRGFVGVRWYTGAQVAADSFMLDRRNSTPDFWTADHKLLGYAYAIVSLRYSANVWAAGIPSISFEIDGVRVLDPRTGLTAWTDNVALCLADYLASDYGPAGVGYPEINEDALIAAANVCEETVKNIVALYDDEFPTDTSAQWLLGQDAIDGTKTVTGGSLVYTVGAGDGVRPRLVRAVTVVIGTTYRVQMDQVKGTAPVRESWVSTSATGGFAEAITPVATTGQPLDETFVATTTTVYLVIRAGTGSAPGNTITLGAASLGKPIPDLPDSEDRYRISTVVSAEEDWRSVAPDMALAMAGGFFRVGASWVVIAGAEVAPTISLGPDDMVGELDVTPRRSRRDLFNRATILSRDEADRYQPIESPMLAPIRFLAEDNGIILPKEFDLSKMVASTGQAQRIASIELHQNRQQITAAGTFRWRALTTVVGDVVLISSDRMGWEDKPFRVVHWELDFEAGVKLGLAEYCDAVYAYPADEALLGCTPSTSFAPPIGATVVPFLTVTREEVGDSLIEWGAAAAFDLVGYTVRWQAIGEVPADGYGFGNGTWIALENEPVLESDFIAAGINDLAVDLDWTLVYRVEVRVLLAGGIYGDWRSVISFPVAP